VGDRRGGHVKIGLVDMLPVLVASHVSRRGEGEALERDGENVVVTETRVQGFDFTESRSHGDLRSTQQVSRAGA
jgi:hypothetical protein